MKAGPKKGLSAGPLDLSGLPKAGPKRVQGFIEGYLRVPKGTGARKPFKLRPFQREIVRGVFPHPNTGPRPRQGLVSVARGNAKSTLAAALGLYALFADGEEGAQVLCVASDMRQALIVFNAARRMVELSPELASRCHVYTGDHRARIYVPETDSTLMPLPSDPDALQGWDPSFCVVDELHVVNEDTWQAMTGAAGKRERSVVLAISTPSDSQDSIMWSLVKHGREHPEDRRFYFREWSAPEGHPSDCRHCWNLANPALGDFLHEDALEATHRTTREGAFRRFRLGQWVVGADVWLPFGAWDACAHPERAVPDGERVVLFFDGSASGDSTALVGCTIAGPHLFVVGVWANPGDARWRVPRGEVSRTVEAAFARYDVAELAADPWGWRSEIEGWSERWPGRVIEWPTNTLHRMGPATDRAFQAILSKTVSHDGDSRLAEHVGNANAKSTPMGDVIVKERKWSPHKIDAAVCAIGAYDRATHYGRARARRRVVAW